MKTYKLYAKNNPLELINFYYWYGFGESFPENGVLLEPVAHITGMVDCMKTGPLRMNSAYLFTPQL